MKKLTKKQWIYLLLVIVPLLLAYLLPLIPLVYTKTNGYIMPINAYSFLTYQNDTSNKTLYYSTVCFTFYLVLCTLYCLLYILAFFVKEEKIIKITYSLTVVSILDLIATIAMTVLIYFSKVSNIYINLGCYVLILFCFLLVVYSILSIIHHSKNIKPILEDKQ